LNNVQDSPSANPITSTFESIKSSINAASKLQLFKSEVCLDENRQQSSQLTSSSTRRIISALSIANQTSAGGVHMREANKQVTLSFLMSLDISGRKELVSTGLNIVEARQSLHGIIRNTLLILELTISA
jgi:hypothetical protein